MTRLCRGSEKYIHVVERMCGREAEAGAINRNSQHLCVASFSYFCPPSQTTRSTVLALFAFGFFS